MTIKPARRRGKGRMSGAQLAIIGLITNQNAGHVELSYDDMAARIPTVDRRTLITAVRQLEYAGRIRIDRGTGRRPNRYTLV